MTENEILYDWQLPKPLKNRCNAPEPFNLHVLPETLRKYVEAVAKNIQVSADMCMLPLLSTLSLCLQGKAVVQHPVTTDYIQHLCLYTLTVAQSGERKSSVFKAFTEPVTSYFMKLNEANKSDIAVYNSTLSAYRNQKAIAEKKGNISGVREWVEKIAELEKSPRKHITATVTDATVEALSMVMKDNNGKIGVFSAEGGMLDTLTGDNTKDRATNIDLFLNGYDGDSVETIRVSRTAVELKRPLITISLMAQQGKFASFFNNPIASDRGLTSRFMYAFPPNLYGQQKFGSEVIDEKIKADYNSLIERLLNMPESEKPPVLSFDRQVCGLLEDYFYSLQDKNYTTLKSYPGWSSKHFARLLRISGLLHLCTHEPAEKIDMATAWGAVSVCEWAEKQLLYGTRSMKTETLKNMEKILLFLQNIVKSQEKAVIDFDAGYRPAKNITINRGDLYSRHLKKNECVEPLETLESLGCIRCEPTRTGGCIIHINPYICDKNHGYTL